MCMLSERVQVLLTPEQRARVERLAAQQGTSVGAVVREAVEAYTRPRGRSREEAARALFALDAPVADWEDMKAEILRAVGG